MFDFTSHKLLSFQAKAQQAKEAHKPSLSCKASMLAYQKTVGATGKASFGIPSLAIDYVS